MIGTKLYKGNPNDMNKYTDCAVWCNANNATLEDKGEYYEVVENAVHVPTLDELKANKISDFKNKRDTLEVEPIEYNGNLFDYDEKARDRINSALVALDLSKQSIEWTTADNTNVTINSDDLRGIIAKVAERSNQLHIRYRELKEQIEFCQTKEDLEAIQF